MSNVPSNATITHLTEHVILNTAPTVDLDGACHIEANGSDHIHLDSRTKHTQGTIIPTLFDDAGNTLATTTTNKVQYAASATVDFNNAALTNAVFTDDTSFASGTTVNFNNATVSNFALGSGALSASAVASANGYASLDAELDAVTSTQNTVKARTENLTAGRMMKASGAGVLVVSDVPETDVGRLTTAQTFTGSKKFADTVRVDVAGDETALHLAGNHDNTNNAGGKLRLTKFKADKATADSSTVIYQDGLNLHGNTNLVSGCIGSGVTKGFRFQAFKTRVIDGADVTTNFDDVISASDVDTLGYITRSGINCTSGEYLKNGSQITYTDLAGTIATAQIGGTQVTDAKIAAVAASKITGTIATAQVGDTQITDAKIAAVAATKLTGTIATARIPDLAASKVTTGTLAVDRIPALAASKVTSGAFDVARVPDLAASKITSGAFDVARVPDLAASKITSGTLDVARIPALPAAVITSGTLGLSRMPALPASIITSGTLGVDRIPDLPASKVTSGSLSVARIPDLAAGKITSGFIGQDRIPDLSASKVTTGTLGVDRIPDLPAAQITSGTLGLSRIPDLPAALITSGTLGTARIPALPASIITSGTLPTARLDVSAINAGANAYTISVANQFAALATFGGGINFGSALGVFSNKKTLRVASNGGTTLEDEQIIKDSGFAKVASGQRLVADNCTVTGSMKIAEDTPAGAGMNLQNGLPTDSYDTTNKSQIMFGYNGTGQYPHYIKSSHQSDTAAAAQDAGSKLDFLINDGEADVGLATAIEAHAPKVLSISSQSVRCHKELRPDAGILMPFGTAGYNLVHQILPHSVIGTSHQLFVRFVTINVDNTAFKAGEALQPHKGADNSTSTRVGGSVTANVNATEVDDKTNSGGDTASIAFGNSDLSTSDHPISSFAGYLYWGTGWDSAVQSAGNRLVRVGIQATEGLNLYCDGKLVSAQFRANTNSIDGTGAAVAYYAFTARGAYTALEGHITTDATNMVGTMEFTCFAYW